MPRRRDYNAVMKPRKQSNKLNVSLIFSTSDADDFKSDQDFSDILSTCSRSTSKTDTLQSGVSLQSGASLISTPRTSPTSSVPTTPITTSPPRYLPRCSPTSSVPTTPTSTTSPPRSYPPTPTTPDSCFSNTPRSSVTSREESFYDSLGANHEAASSVISREESFYDSLGANHEASEVASRNSSSGSFSEVPVDQTPLLDPTTPTNHQTFEYRQDMKPRPKETEVVMRPQRQATIDKSEESPFSRIRATNLSLKKRKTTARRLSQGSDTPVMTPRREYSTASSPCTSPPGSRLTISPSNSRSGSESRQDPLAVRTPDSRLRTPDATARSRKLSDSRSLPKRLPSTASDSEKRSSTLKREARKHSDSRTDSNRLSSPSSRENGKAPVGKAAPVENGKGPVEQPVPPQRSSSIRASESERIPIGRPARQNTCASQPLPQPKSKETNGDHQYMTRRDSTLIYNDFEEMEALLLEKEALAENLERERQEKLELEKLRQEQEEKQEQMQGTIHNLENEIVNVDCQMLKLRMETDESEALEQVEDEKRSLQARLIQERGKQRQYDDLISVSGMSIYSENGLMLNQDISDYTKRDLLESVRSLRKERGELEKTIKQLRCDSANEKRKQDKVIKDLMAQIRGFHMPVQRADSSGPQETMALISDLKFQLDQLKNQNKSQTKLIERLVTERNHHLVEMARLKGNSEESLHLKEEVS